MKIDYVNTIQKMNRLQTKIRKRENRAKRIKRFMGGVLREVCYGSFWLLVGGAIIYSCSLLSH